jgi:alanyl-tRNA synthetase
MYRLIPALIESMGDAYPELIAQQDLIEKVIKEEEDSFLRTLETGIRLLDKQIQDAKSENKTIIDGVNAFVLYDTYGFPFDLTELILREQNMTVDKTTFDTEMQKQKERARNAAATETGDWIILSDGEPEFVGYDETSAEAHILRYRKVKQKNTEYYQIVLSQTPFYAEMGGQVGDSGVLVPRHSNENQNLPKPVDIFDTKRENNLAVHLVNSLPEDLSDTFTAIVDLKKRRATECNHTATHLLHEALREILGTHIEQKGSFVSPELLRFDFSHFQKVTDEEIRRVERVVNAKIRENIALMESRCVPITQAKEMGAMALFSEKYGDEVRVIRFGTSVELCGGTHISATGRIGSFQIVSESSIAAGIRRIEAITGEMVENFYYALQDLVRDIKSLFNNTPDVLQAMRKFFDENSDLKKQLEVFMKEKMTLIKQRVIERKQHINGVNVFVLKGAFPAEIVKDIAFQIKGEFPEKSYFAAATQTGGKPLLTLMISDDLVQNGLNAGQIVREAAKHIQGGGGGQAHFATAGGKDITGLEAALEAMLACA